MADNMRFRNFGGIHQFVVSDELDLSKIDQLDAARWAATSAPLHDLHCDPAFLAFLDPDGLGRIRVSQLIAGREWLFDRLANRARLRERSEKLVLADLRSDNEAGPKLRVAANHVLHELNLHDRADLSLQEVRDFRAGYAKTLANGDGVVPPEVVPEEGVAQLIKEIMPAVGSSKDAGGSDGVGQPELDKFIERGKAYLEWRGKAAAASPWGADTEAAAALVTALDGKIEEYFWHCEFLRQQSKTAEDLRLKDDDLRLVQAKDSAALEKYLAESPLATPVPGATLALAATAINSVYRDKFEELRAKVISRVLGAGTTTLTSAGWRQVKAIFEAFDAWQEDKPAEPFDVLGEARIKEILDGPLPARVAHYIAIDKAAAPELEQITQVEKLILYQRWLLELVNNFVNFSAIYRPEEQALVEMGSIVIDGRRLDFCVKVVDRGAHKKVAAESLIYLVYVQILEKESGAAAYEVVAPVTAGERGRLRVGKRGIFIDTKGKEWDAIVVDIIDNAISVKEAAFAPFRRAALFVGKKIEDWVGSAQAAQEKQMIASADKQVTEAQKNTEQTAKDVADGKAPPPPAKEPAKKESEGLNVNTLILGGGMALAGLGAVMAGLFSMLTSLKGWLAILGIVAAVMGLSALFGWLKLRRRDMSLVLEANGWALNVQMKINRRIGRVFTYTPALPKGAVMERVDLLATKEDRSSAPWVIALLVVLGAGAYGGYYYYKNIYGH